MGRMRTLAWITVVCGMACVHVDNLLHAGVS
jgi:hypothetical protein